MTWKQVGDFAFYGCTAAAVTFVLCYLALAPWWRSEAGRNIMAVMASMALAFSYFTFAIIQGGVPLGFYPARAVIFMFIFLSISWRVVILLRVQRPRRREKEKQ